MHLTVTLLKPRHKILGPTTNILRKDYPAFNKFHRGRKTFPKIKRKEN